MSEDVFIDFVEDEPADDVRIKEDQITAEDIITAHASNFAEDVLMALRYHYYVNHKPICTDGAYDVAERDFLERPTTDFESPVSAVGSDIPESYPLRIRLLAGYMSAINQERYAKGRR